MCVQPRSRSNTGGQTSLKSADEAELREDIVFAGELPGAVSGNGTNPLQNSAFY